MNYYTREHIEKVYILKADSIASLECLAWVRTTQSDRIKLKKSELLDYLHKAWCHASEEVKPFVKTLQSEVERWAQC
jgi:hypothetical protein